MRLSPGRFMRAFKKSFGVPVRRYLLQKRIQAAKSMLSHSDKSLLTVALEVGSLINQPSIEASVSSSELRRPLAKSKCAHAKAVKLLTQD